MSINCPHCGGVINPARLLAQMPRTMTPARKAAQEKATEAATEKRRVKKDAGR